MPREPQASHVLEGSEEVRARRRRTGAGWTEAEGRRHLHLGGGGHGQGGRMASGGERGMGAVRVPRVLGVGEAGERSCQTVRL